MPSTGGGGLGFELQITFWLWLTVLFANFAEAMAEGRGKAQADTLRQGEDRDGREPRAPGRDATEDGAGAGAAQGRHRPMVTAGEVIPADGEIIEGVASVDESGDHRRVGAGHPRVRRRSVRGDRRHEGAVGLDRIRITADPGETFLDRMIALVEGAERQKTPNEIALNILLAGLTIIFLIAVVTLQPFAIYSGAPQSVFVLVVAAGLPDPDDDRRPAVGDRHRRHGPAGAAQRAGDVGARGRSGRRRAHAAARQDRHDHARQPPGDRVRSVAGRQRSGSWPTRRSWRRSPDETPEGRSIVVLAKEKYGLRGRELAPQQAHVRPVHRADADVRRRSACARRRRDRGEGARGGAIASKVASSRREVGGGTVPPELAGDRRAHRPRRRHAARRRRRTPRARRDPSKDIVKGGIRERFAHLRAMGIKTVMITGDNPLTAAAIAAEAGVDDFLAQATPEDKMALIKREQADGKLVAMTGDGTNDAPALAQADVGVAMNTGTQAAKEAGNMVDLDSNPTKLIEIVEIGKQLLITRGALTTFSIANDVAKYFAIIPAMFLAAFPLLGALNIMGLRTPQSAILSAVIFNALIIVALVPLALRGIRYRPEGAAALAAAQPAGLRRRRRDRARSSASR